MRAAQTFDCENVVVSMAAAFHGPKSIRIVTMKWIFILVRAACGGGIRNISDADEGTSQ